MQVWLHIENFVQELIYDRLFIVDHTGRHSIDFKFGILDNLCLNVRHTTPLGRLRFLEGFLALGLILGNLLLCFLFSLRK